MTGRFFCGGEKDDNKRIICEGAGLIRWSKRIFWVLRWCGSVWRSAIWGEGRGRMAKMAKMARMARMARDDEGGGGMYGACMEPVRSARSVYGDW